MGNTGLAAAARRPDLLAAVDQHAGAVREDLRFAAGRPTRRPADLAAYAEGFRDTAVEYGWSVPDGPVDWADPDWVALRLLAVCALVPAPGGRCGR